MTQIKHPIAAVVEAMYHAGASLAAVLNAVRAMEDASARTNSVSASASAPLSAVMSASYSADSKERRRQKDRERKRLARFRPDGDTADTSADNAELSAVSMRTDDADIADISPTPPSIIKEGTLEVEVLEGKKEGSGVFTRVGRGTRIPVDFTPDESCVTLAREFHFLRMDWRTCLEEFQDHWRAVPGARGTKIDWQATFRNQIRRYASMRKGKLNGTPQNSIAGSFSLVDDAINDIERRQREEGAGHSHEDPAALS